MYIENNPGIYERKKVRFSNFLFLVDSVVKILFFLPFFWSLACFLHFFLESYISSCSKRVSFFLKPFIYKFPPQSYSEMRENNKFWNINFQTLSVEYLFWSTLYFKDLKKNQYLLTHKWTSAPIVAWKWNFLPFRKLWQTDHSTDRSNDRATDRREVVSICFK